uniref:Uncharacterized protein At4g22758-like n=1 Tax=Nicotiana tabacum TaxID=4097 RepID=A0A1S3Z2E8_TOBAC|nr:PREDICTED: uncharacterized protein At4g22758-like [Nicotiana tabacum]
MSERHLGRRIPMCERASSSSVQKPSFPTRRTSKQHRKRKTIERCKSEPCLWRVNGVGDNEDDRRDVTTSLEVLLRPQTCSNIFFSPDYLNNVSSPQGSRGYNKDAKVVVNVTVEGTPGPIRTMVKLGSSVDETIRFVLSKYREEGRSPHLDKSSPSSFKLYSSYFSLESLSNTDMIGDVWSRSFYLRKSNSNGNNSRNAEIATDITSMEANSNPIIVVINKIIRTSKLWKFLGCIRCFG